MFNYIEIEKILNHAFINLRDEIKVSLEYNHSINFNSGCLGERLNFVLHDSKGQPSNGGGGFDANDGSEAKAVFLAQPGKCNDCGSKVHYYAHQCTCGSTNITPKDDSRWGISCSAHFKYENDIPFYCFTSIEPLNKSIAKPAFRIRVFRIETQNLFFTQLLKFQLDHGRNNTKNFMPFGRDFYMSLPTELLSVDLTIDDHISYSYNNTEPYVIDTFSSQLLTKAERELLNDVSVVSVLDAVNIIGLRDNSTHGKERGHTQRKGLKC